MGEGKSAKYHDSTHRGRLPLFERACALLSHFICLYMFHFLISFFPVLSISSLSWSLPRFDLMRLGLERVAGRLIISVEGVSHAYDSSARALSEAHAMVNRPLGVCDSIYLPQASA